MGSRICFVLLLFFLVLGIATSSLLDYDTVETPGEKGRSLLEKKKEPKMTEPCPFDVKKANYKIVTSQCQKQPFLYPAKACCKSFKQLTCKYRDYLNEDNTCAEEMIEYLRNYGKYPPGTFRRVCEEFEGKKDLDCAGY
ncbi:PREDICTED: GPI-anchored protein LLG2-like [Ipomoea nil]|uniref:GPI-anchored protein LLG2-like n=1 Tax=Ipomoea nil TaxID=35883 RepID=UPI000900933E|nr:PREDICTED: GPI-anchored protein LLG2-like [Ipomoea nil]